MRSDHQKLGFYLLIAPLLLWISWSKAGFFIIIGIRIIVGPMTKWRSWLFDLVF